MESQFGAVRRYIDSAVTAARRCSTETCILCDVLQECNAIEDTVANKWMSTGYTTVLSISNFTEKCLIQPLSYGVPVRERYGSTLLPATREQHDQNCTQSH